MSKNKLEAAVMNKISAGHIIMKPRWYFVLGSVLMGLGLVAASIGTIFLINLNFFLLRQHGPMGELKLQLMLESFPWWIPLLAISGIAAGVFLLKKYDFSYKKNFALIASIFIIAIILAAFLIDLTGINDTWFRQGPMKRLYQKQRTIQQSSEQHLTPSPRSRSLRQ